MTMPTVRVREKRQVTIPLVIAHEFHLKTDDVLEVQVTTAGILMSPKTPFGAKKNPMRFWGAAQGVYENPEAADTFIRNLRDEWK
jgi:bifunctional DNA-binding transcriptional regulator/antitoxin component of YhaV-PrlF toxin-antitoxin module